MRSSLRSSLLTAAVLGAAASPAAAQLAAATDRTHPVVSTEGAMVDALVRPIVTYRFTGWRGAGLPTEVSVADSLGTLVASFRTLRDPAGRPMSVSVSGTDIVLNGLTPVGPLTLELYEQTGRGSDRSLVGRWTVGQRSGELRGRFVRSQVVAALRP